MTSNHQDIDELIRQYEEAQNRILNNAYIKLDSNLVSIFTTFYAILTMSGGQLSKGALCLAAAGFLQLLNYSHFRFA